MGDRRSLEVIDSQSEDCATLEDFFLASNQWKCVYQETVLGLDKCYSDVNKAGERDGGRTDKGGWERRDSRGKDPEQVKSVETRRHPAFPCSGEQE